MKNVNLVPNLFRSSCLQIFYKIGVLKNLAKIQKLYWSHFLKGCRSQGLKLHLKRLQHRYFSVNFAQFFKYLIYRTPPNDYYCWFCRSNQGLIHRSHLLFFPSFFIDNCNYGTLFRKCIKMKTLLLCTIVYQKIHMNVVKTISLRQ